MGVPSIPSRNSSDPREGTLSQVGPAGIAPDDGRRGLTGRDHHARSEQAPACKRPQKHEPPEAPATTAGVGTTEYKIRDGYVGEIAGRNTEQEMRRSPATRHFGK